MSKKSEKTSKLSLKPSPTLGDVQKYVAEMEKERGFNTQSTQDKCLLIGEELGELFKSIRKDTGVKIDRKSNFKNIAEELADILIYICSIANKYSIDLEIAFRNKEKINKKRTWQ